MTAPSVAPREQTTAALLCGVCRDPARPIDPAVDDVDFRLCHRDGAGEWTWEGFGPAHAGDCRRSLMATAGLSEDRRRQVLVLRDRSARQRAGWHGSAGEKGPGL